LQEAMQIISQ